MLCYKDMTFCKFHVLCKNGSECPRALTKEVLDSAENRGLPISQFAEFPKCYEEVFLENKKRIPAQVAEQRRER